MYLSAVDVKALPQVMGALIALGDSVIDSVASTTDACFNDRFPRTEAVERRS